MEALEKLLKYRTNYQDIKAIIIGGCLYPMSNKASDDTRLSDLRAMIARGNYKSANNPTAKSIAKEKYIKEIAKL